MAPLWGRGLGTSGVGRAPNADSVLQQYSDAQVLLLPQQRLPQQSPSSEATSGAARSLPRGVASGRSRVGVALPLQRGGASPRSGPPSREGGLAPAAPLRPWLRIHAVLQRPAPRAPEARALAGARAAGG